MSAKTIEAARIAGAKCCIDLLHKAKTETVAVASDSVADIFHKKDAALATFMTAAGALSPRAEGVLAALVELAIDGFQNGYTLDQQLNTDYYEWLPESTMTSQQVETARATFAEQVAMDVASDLAMENARKVVSIADWSAH